MSANFGNLVPEALATICSPAVRTAMGYLSARIPGNPLDPERPLRSPGSSGNFPLLNRLRILFVGRGCVAGQQGLQRGQASLQFPILFLLKLNGFRLLLNLQVLFLHLVQ
jgi:hypothetical protein